MLTKQNPELYKYVCAILDLYLGSDDKTCECDKQCKKRNNDRRSGINIEPILKVR